MKWEDEVGSCILEHYEQLYRVAYNYVHNENDAMDIVQEASYKAIKSCSSIKQKQYIKTWLYRIVINTALDFIKKKRQEVIGVEDYLVEYKENYEQYEVLDSLNQLEEKEKTVIILRFFEDRKLSEIAEITNEKISTVKTRLYRGLKKLKLELCEI